MNTVVGKERAILDAAMRLFSRHGYRKTSIEEIAGAAGIGKGTVYLYFESKEALFRALCAHITAQVLAEVEVLAAEEGAVFPRLAAVLRVKFGRLFRIVAGAPYGRELVESRDELASDLFRDFDRRFEAIVLSLVERGVIRRELRSTSQRLTAKAIAQTLLAAARGVSLAAHDAVDFDRRFEELLAVIAEGLTT